MSANFRRNKIDLQNIIDANRTRINNLKLETKIYNAVIEIVEANEEIIKKLLVENEELSQRINDLENDVQKLKSKFSTLEAIEKLHECDAFANRNFQKEYRKEFNLSKYSKDVPTIGDFINDPPEEKENQKEYNFWLKFNKLYPGSNNPEFNRIYRKINENRMSYAHLDVSNITIDEFVNAIETVFPEEYKINRKLYPTKIKFPLQFSGN